MNDFKWEKDVEIFMKSKSDVSFQYNEIKNNKLIELINVIEITSKLLIIIHIKEYTSFRAWQDPRFSKK